jgi:hypothetical protein
MNCRTDVTDPCLPALDTPLPAIEGLGRPYSQRQKTGFLNWPFILYRTDKVKYVSIHAMRVYGESAFTALNILNPGPRQKWVFNFKLRLLYSRKGVLHVNWTGSRVDPSTGLNTLAKRKILCSNLELKHDPFDFPARSLVLIPAAHKILMLRNGETSLSSPLAVRGAYLKFDTEISTILSRIFRIFPRTSRQMTR